MVAVGQALLDAGLQIINGRVGAAAPAGLPVVGGKNLVDAFFLPGAFVALHIEQAVFGRGELEHSVGNVFRQGFFQTRGWIYGQEPETLVSFPGEIVFVGNGHPRDPVGCAGEDPPGRSFGYLGEAFRLAAFARGRIGSDQPLSVGRDGYAGNAGSQQDVFHPIPVLSVFAEGEDPFGRRFERDFQLRLLAGFQQIVDLSPVRARLEFDRAVGRLAIQQEMVFLHVSFEDNRYGRETAVFEIKGNPAGRSYRTVGF